MRDTIYIQDKTVELFRAEDQGAPLVILNSYMRSNGEIYGKCREIGCPDFSLAEISGLSWDDEMSPWEALQLNDNDAPYGGKADEYLELLLEKIVPAVKERLDGEPRSIMLTGYSLAGLFALYAATKCDVFDAVASCSGSMWFPGFAEYIKSQEIGKLPKRVYFSLGDREARTKNKTLQTVEDRTREIERYLHENGIDTALEMNKGNHFQQATLRTAKGIKWLLE